MREEDNVNTYSVAAQLKAVGADKFASDFKNASRSVEGFVQKNEKTFASFRQVGTVATAAGVAVAGGLGYAVSRAAEFEGKMSKIAAVSGATGKDFQVLSDKAREMGSKTSFSAGEAAEGLEYMALAGWDTQQMMSGLEPILHLAEAGSLDLGRASDLVTDSMAAMGIEVKDLDGYLDKVAATSANANTDIDALMEAFVVAGGTFDRFNVPLDEANAFLGVLANRGTKGSEAGTALNAIMTRLGQSTGPAADALEEMGISAYDADGNFRGMEVVMKDIQKEMEGMTDKEKAHYTEQLAGLNHGKSFTKMLQGLGDEYSDLKGDIENSNGALEEMRNIMKDNLQGALENLSSAFDEIMISVGEALLPAVKMLVAALQTLADWFNNLSDSTKSFVAIGTALVAVFLLIAGPVLLLIGFIPQIVAGITAIVTVLKAIGATIAVLAGTVSLPFILITAAVAAAAAAIYIYWEPIKEFFFNLWESIKEMGMQIWENLTQSWQETVELLKSIWGTITEFFSVLWEGVKTIFTTVWNAIKEVVITAVNGIKTVISAVFTSIKTVFTTALTGYQNIFTTVWNAIKTVVTNVINGIKTVISTVFNVIKSIITSVLNAIRSTVTSVWNGIKSVITSVLSGISSVVTSVWNTIKSVITGVLNGIRSIVTSVFNAISSVISSIMSSISSTISSVWSAISSTVSSVVNGIKSIISSVFNALAGIVTGAMSGVKSAITSGMNAALNVVTNIGSSFKEAGSKIVSMIADGIKAAAGKVTGAAKDLMGKVRNFLPFSPAKDGPLRDLHKLNFGGTIAGSIDRGQSTAVKAMNNMMENVRGVGEPGISLDAGLNVGNKIASINSQAERQLSHTFDSSINVNNKQPAYINVSIANRDFEGFVEDISEVQDRKTMLEKAFS